MYTHPTILVARDNGGLDGNLIELLEQKGFLVLEAEGGLHALEVVKFHSRPIHVMLADVSMDAYVPLLQAHLSTLQVLFVKKPVDKDDVLSKV